MNYIIHLELAINNKKFNICNETFRNNLFKDFN